MELKYLLGSLVGFGLAVPATIIQADKGMRGLDGMLRRHLYVSGEFQFDMILATICGSMILLAWVLFLLNIVISVGVKGLIGIFLPATDSTASYGIEPESMAQNHK